MRNAFRIIALLLAAAMTPSPAFAWGFAGHRLIMRRAIGLLPPALQPFFEHYRDEIVVRVVDPDLWRNVGWEEDPNHFVDFGAKEYGAFPFADLPRDLDAAVEKFGMATLKRNGMLPWRANELFGNLRRTFEGFTRGTVYGANDAVLFSAALSHYMQDANQPFHATINYDGQLTGNNGIHTRFERDLIERFAPRLTLTPAPPTPVADPRDFAFSTLLDSYKLVDGIIQADTAAVAGKDVYDDEYYEKFFTRVKSVLEKRLSDAITATASVIAGAWEAAGRPAVKTADARPLQKVKR